jgi:hypothetical protein
MMEAPGPVNDDIGHSGQNNISSINTTAGGQLAKIKQSLKARVIPSLDLKCRVQTLVFTCFYELGGERVLGDRFGSQGVHPGRQVLDVVRVVERLELHGGRLLEVVDVQLFVQTVTVDQGVGHFYAFCLHRVLFRELVLRYLLVVQIGNFRVHQSVNTINYYMLIIRFKELPISILIRYL